VNAVALAQSGATLAAVSHHSIDWNAYLILTLLLLIALIFVIYNYSTRDASRYRVHTSRYECRLTLLVG
jgi:uncharacterized integral membrane protein